VTMSHQVENTHKENIIEIGVIWKFWSRKTQ
jgi:hypothetical protein